MSGAPQAREQVYAVVRLDELLDGADPALAVTVKEVVWSQALAEAEVARLTALNAPKGARYFWQATRLFPPGASAGAGAVR